MKPKREIVKPSETEAYMIGLTPGASVHVDGASMGHGVVSIRCTADALEVVRKSADRSVVFLSLEG